MNPYLILGIAVAAFFGGWEVNGWRLEADFTAEKLAITARNKKELEDRIAEVRGQENAAKKDLTVVATTLQQNLSKKEKDLEEARRHIRTGFQRLFDANARQCPTDVPGSSGPGRGNDGEGRTQLSDAVADFFGGEARRANQIVEKLSACQATVRIYEKTCTGVTK